MEVSKKKMPFLWQKQDSDRSRGLRQLEQVHSHHSTEKKLAYDIVGLVGKILNKTVESGEVLYDWRAANIKPVFKRKK